MSSAFGKATLNRSSCRRDRATKARPSSHVMLRPAFSIRLITWASATGTSIAECCAQIVAPNPSIVKQIHSLILGSMHGKFPQLGRRCFVLHDTDATHLKNLPKLCIGTCLYGLILLWVVGPVVIFPLHIDADCRGSRP